MKIQTQNNAQPINPRPTTRLPVATPTVTDKVELDFQGSRPAHRVVKQIARGAAGVVGLAGLAKAGLDLMTSPTLETGLLKAALTLAGTGAAIVGMDLVSGLVHHRGDNYGGQNLKHTKWHTNTHATDYCLVGVSNKALDKVGFWPRWEKMVYNVSGKEPRAWQVEPYRNFALGKIDEQQLQAELSKLGMPSQ